MKIIDFTNTGKPTTHGTRTNYNRGCRCDDCTSVQADDNKKRAAERREQFKKGELEVSHGKESTYVNYGCRCGRCKEAHSEAMIRQSKSRRESFSKGDIKVTHGALRTYKSYGCRCELCREANSLYTKTYYKNTEMPDDAHGKVASYNQRGCRCDECKEAYREYKADYRKRNPERSKQWADSARNAREARLERLRNGEVEVEHGTVNAYITWGCRCEVCRLESSKRYYARKTEKE